jgi:peroxiredoxin-like protein
MATAGEVPAVRVAAPVEFDGPGDAWSPEHLLLAAVQSCFLLTLRGVARRSKVEIVRLDVETEGVVNRQDGVTRFSDILMRARLTVPAGTGRDRALALMLKAEQGCLVAASLSTRVRMEPEVIEETAAQVA